MGVDGELPHAESAPSARMAAPRNGAIRFSMTWTSDRRDGPCCGWNDMQSQGPGGCMSRTLDTTRCRECGRRFERLQGGSRLGGKTCLRKSRRNLRYAFEDLSKRASRRDHNEQGRRSTCGRSVERCRLTSVDHASPCCRANFFGNFALTKSYDCFT